MHDIPGKEFVSAEQFDNGMTNDLILDVQYFVLDAILELFCQNRWKKIASTQEAKVS